MARFVFKLESVLRHRRSVEDQCQRRLAELLREQMALRNQLENHQQTIRDDKRTMADSLVGSVDLGRIRGHAAYVHQSTVRAQQIGFGLVELNRRIELAREELARAVRQRKAVQVLRDRQYRRWLEAHKRREAAELDELGVQGYRRHRQGAGR